MQKFLFLIFDFQKIRSNRILLETGDDTSSFLEEHVKLPVSPDFYPYAACTRTSRSVFPHVPGKSLWKCIIITPFIIRFHQILQCIIKKKTKLFFLRHWPKLTNLYRYSTYDRCRLYWHINGKQFCTQKKGQETSHLLLKNFVSSSLYFPLPVIRGRVSCYRQVVQSFKVVIQVEQTFRLLPRLFVKSLIIK